MDILVLQALRLYTCRDFHLCNILRIHLLCYIHLYVSRLNFFSKFSDSDSESDEEPGNSFSEQKRIQKLKQKTETPGPSKVAVILNVSQGQLTFRAPLKVR